MRMLGKKKHINDCGEMSDVYMRIAEEDEKAANILSQAGYYNQSVYYMIQSMEKYIKGLICKKVNVMNGYFETKLFKTGHSLDDSLDFLIEIMAGGDKLLEEHLKIQMKEEILENVKYSKLYNEVRYPGYKRHNQRYSILEISSKDYQEIHNTFSILKRFLDDLIRM